MLTNIRALADQFVIALPNINSPLGITTALGSNRLTRALKINPQSWWRQDPPGSL